jgi:hypothetical protein
MRFSKDELRSADLSHVPVGMVECFLFENSRLFFSPRGLTEVVTRGTRNR